MNFHAAQFRKALLPHQLEHFPHQAFTYLTLEMEYEAHIAEQLYLHEKLRADPHASGDAADYMRFLNEFDDWLAGIDRSKTYERFVHVESEYYAGVIAKTRAMLPRLREESAPWLRLREQGL